MLEKIKRFLNRLFGLTWLQKEMLRILSSRNKLWQSKIIMTAIQIQDSLQQRTGYDVSLVKIYSQLEDMFKMGLVSEEMITEGQTKRMHFAITPKGEEVFERLW